MDVDERDAEHAHREQHRQRRAEEVFRASLPRGCPSGGVGAVAPVMTMFFLTSGVGGGGRDRARCVAAGRFGGDVGFSLRWFRRHE
ncbi:hypothetical protein Ga0074812_1397 [Parafrankia irregularis]|uniref:Uncharacterized protein n=1 Tax=Parafrankia irregularis TaxID=795642 RepID=A0A0S4R0K3_9ACTN|nr:hypothetical protein Ga0074812_1397 [Parafrankia irregularis]